MEKYKKLSQQSDPVIVKQPTKGTCTANLINAPNILVH
jgi:hypothetical protein